MPVSLKPRVTDLGEFSVGRVLPNKVKRMVGPFVFFDHMGPAHFEPGQGVNVRPHPHIGLATLTYLLEGRILHRDSLGNCVEIQPGDVNWMVAGKGITHSERETIETNCQPHALDGVQCWVALPREQAEIEPSFTHVEKFELPHRIIEGVTARLVIGEAYGMRTSTKTFSPMFLLDVLAQPGSTVERPNPTQECLLYLADGSITVGGENVEKGATVLIDQGENIEVQEYSRMVMLGGEEWTELPFLEWNFVSFDRDRLNQAKADWEAGNFPAVVGDDEEKIPLPS